MTPSDEDSTSAVGDSINDEGTQVRVPSTSDLDDASDAALALLRADGLTDSEAVRDALREVVSVAGRGQRLPPRSKRWSAMTKTVRRRGRSVS